MTNLELADKLQATAAQHYGDLCGMLWDGGAALRNLHTENMALRCTEMALRDINAELVDALKKIIGIELKEFGLDWEEIEEAQGIARAALAKAEGGEL